MPEARGAREVKTLVPGDEIRDDVTGERFRVVSLIGEGGMGQVFKVTHEETGAIYAIKCNPPIDPNNKSLVERVRREGDFLKGLRPHPHIVPVLSTGVTAEGVCWMRMPLLDGASVGGLLHVLGRVPLVWAMEICRAVCSALAAVHSAAIHRDIKPDNVFVTRQGGIYVLDWGAGKFYSVGRLTTTGTTLGTIPYSSPEQLRDPEHLDGRSDLFSVGILAFLMLSGKHPFGRDGALHEDRITLGYRIIHERPRSLAELAPELPGYVPKIVEKLLAKAREDRSRNAQEAAGVFVAALNEIRSRLGEPLPISHLFEDYDAALAAREAERIALAATEKSEAAPSLSSPKPKLGTMPIAAYVAPSHPIVEPIAAPKVELAAPSVVESALRGGTEPMAVATVAASSPAASVVPVSTAVGSAATALPVFEPVPAPEPPLAPAVDPEEEAAIQQRLQAIAVLSSDHAPETREALLAVLRDADESPVVRASAASALRLVGDAACLPALEECASGDPHPIVRRVAEDAAVTLARRVGRSVEPMPLVVAPRPPSPVSPATEEPSRWALSLPPVIPPPVVASPSPQKEWSTTELAIVALLSLLLSTVVVFFLVYFLVP